MRERHVSRSKPQGEHERLLGAVERLERARVLREDLAPDVLSDGDHQRLARREMAEKPSDRDARARRDELHARARVTGLDEDLARRVEHLADRPLAPLGLRPTRLAHRASSSCARATFSPAGRN